MEDKKSENKFLICPACGGTGKGRAGLSCASCAGMGLGTFYQGRFFYWGLKLGRAVIQLSHFKRTAQLVVNLIAFTIGLIGLLALGWWIFLASRNLAELGAFSFWRQQHPLILIFWTSVIADMFVVYRLSSEEDLKHKIREFKKEAEPKAIEFPENLDKLKDIKNTVNVWNGFNMQSEKAVEDAYLLANSLGQPRVATMHLFYSALQDIEVSALFSRLNVNRPKLVEKIKKQISDIPAREGRTELSDEVKKVLIGAYLYAYKSGQKKVEPVHFLLPAINIDSKLSEILFDLEIDKNKIINSLEWFRINDEMIDNYRRYKSMARFKPGSNMDRAYTSVATPVLDHFSYDLTRAAKWGRLPFCVARDKEIKEIFQNMESGSRGVILVGPTGVGKNTIIDGVAQLMVREEVPKILKDKRLVELDASRLVSGANPAKAQERMLVIIDELAKAGNIILYINNIENIVGISAGQEESLDLSEVLVSALERGSIYCLASATDRNWNRYIEGRPLGNIMGKVDVEEPEGNQAIQIVASKIGGLEGKYKVYFSYNALEQVIELSAKYIHDKYLPEKAIQILEKVAVKVSEEKGESSMVTQDDIAAVVSDLTKIPVTKLTEKESKNLLNLETRIHEKMINQEEAVNMVAASLRRARAQLREGKRPIANFLFLGPTGVGKTELAKTVADIYFGDDKYLIRLDMSEYQYADSIRKMIGDETGVLGYLTEAVRKAPFSLVLLDEVEKAHPDILNLFLQVMDDGRLTDGQGRTIDFTNSIIIATSNAGALYIQEQVQGGTNIEQIKEVLINEHLNKVMRPELINRFDGVIVFKPLTKQNVIDIAKLMLARIAKMLDIKGIRMRYEEEGAAVLAEAGFDPKFGARPLRRLLQDRIENEIANQILSGKLKRRDTLVIDKNARVVIEKGEKL